ncbi:MAG: hypothetical protein L0154_12260 [Chloroflexi bacterium]|nr:hypothetical protein [Chloroflexota bacterium]
MALRNPWVIVGIVTAAVVAGLVIFAYYIDDQDPQLAVDVYGEQVEAFCDGAEDATVEGKLPDDVSYPLRIGLINGDIISRFQYELPDTWTSDRIDDLDIIFCIDFERVTIQECEYLSREEEEATVRRTQDVAHMYVFNTDGVLVDKFTIEGFIPPECPRYKSFLGDNRIETQNGPLYNSNFEGGLFTYVTGIHVPILDSFDTRE